MMGDDGGLAVVEVVAVFLAVEAGAVFVDAFELAVAHDGCAGEALVAAGGRAVDDDEVDFAHDLSC